MNENKVFTKENIKGACPKVPQQMNFTDCGLYVLQYVESFFKKPIQDYHIPIKELKNWFKEIVVTRKREELAFLIRDLMGELKKDLRIVPDLTFPTLNGRLLSSTNHEEETPSSEEMETDEHENETSSPPNLSQQSLVSEAYNSDESDDVAKQSETSQISAQSNGSNSITSVKTTSGLCIVSPLVTKPVLVTDTNKSVLKPEISELMQQNNKTSRETMSYLKSKRIQRHRNNEVTKDEIKKLKLSE